MENIDYSKRFKEACDLQEQEFISLCDMRITETEHKIKMYEIENKHWKELKEVFLQNRNNDTIRLQ